MEVWQENKLTQARTSIRGALLNWLALWSESKRPIASKRVDDIQGRRLVKRRDGRAYARPGPGSMAAGDDCCPRFFGPGFHR